MYCSSTESRERGDVNAMINTSFIAVSGVRIPSWKKGVGVCRKGRVAVASKANTRMVLSSEERRAVVVEGPFEGAYGEWSLTQGDVDGVLVYRSSLAVSALAVAAGVALAHMGISGHTLDAMYGVHTAALGVALYTIHIYLKPMHNMLKVLWALGTAGSLALLFSPMLTSGALVTEVVQRPALLLAVGWQFVALTGLFFKESICFAHTEALLLTALVPVLAGGHFLGILPISMEDSAVTVFAIAYAIFALRKFAQPPREDIGDLSVFQHMAKMERES